MNKAIITAMLMLSISFVGCIDEDVPDSTIEPTGASDMDSLERRINDLENETSDLRKDNDKLKNQIDLLHEENHNFSISYDELVLAQENLSTEIAQLQEQIRELQNDEGANNTELIEQIEALEEKVEELEEDIEELNNFREGMYNQLYLLRDLDARPVEFDDWGGKCISGCGIRAYEDFGYVSVTFNSYIHEGILYFVGENNGNGSLWRTNGNGFGTFKVHDAVVDRNTDFYSNIDGFFFKGYDEQYEEEIWFSDGQNQNTYRVTNDFGSSNYGGPTMEVVYNDWIFYTVFSALNGGSYSLWKASNGFEQQYIRSLGYMSNFHATSNGFFFQGSIENGNDLNRQWWFSDGTEEGTHLVKEINPNGSNYFPASLVKDDILYFSGSNENDEREFWRSDGTENGTYIVINLNGNQSANINEITESNGRFYFRADDGGETHFWSSNGTADGTFIVKRNISNAWAYIIGSNNNITYFTLNDHNAPSGETDSIWSTEGSEDTTEHTLNAPISIPSYGTALIENVLYFRHGAYGSGIGNEVWRMDLENNLTSLLHDIYPGEGDSNPTGFVVYKNKLFFGAYEPAFGAEIWYITV
jgi:ELWxxDGT repeat protein